MNARESDWESLAETRLSLRQAAHLYRRLAIGGDAAQLQAATERPLSEVVDQLLAPPLGEPEFARSEAEFTAMHSVAVNGNSATQLPAWWLFRLVHTRYPALEKLVIFWHGHFATSAQKVQSPSLMLRQNETLRRNALGPFGPLVREISSDPAMLLYLDSASNKRNRPNENYARELLELFCLGVGNYDERDIRELARAFSGWELRGDQFQFNRFQHDPGEKTMFGEGGVFSGEDAIARILAQPAAARFIARKLYRYYGSDRLPSDPTALEPLAECLRANDFQIRAALHKLCTSRLFFSGQAIGQKIRSPVELSVGVLRAMQATTSATLLANDLRELGQALFFPPNVAGWDGGTQWINSATLVGRMNLMARLVDDIVNTQTGPGGLDRAHGITSAESAVHWATERLLAVDLDSRRQAGLERLAAKAPSGQKLGVAIKALATLPEFQLG